MTRPIEAIVIEAQQRLDKTGRLDVAAFLSVYPEHAEELQDLLPVMLMLHQERRWRRATAESNQFARGLFGQLVDQAASQPAENSATLGSLLAQERTEAGMSLEEQARRTGIPLQSLERLAEDNTPVDSLDNSTIKQIAGRAAAPFSTLVKEVRRLLSLQSLSGFNTGAVFTRDHQSSTDAERKALVEKVRSANRKPPEDHQG